MVIGTDVEQKKKKRGRRDREFDVEKGVPRRMMARMDISEWNMNMIRGARRS